MLKNLFLAFYHPVRFLLPFGFLRPMRSYKNNGTYQKYSLSSMLQDSFSAIDLQKDLTQFVQLIRLREYLPPIDSRDAEHVRIHARTTTTAHPTSSRVFSSLPDARIQTATTSPIWRTMVLMRIGNPLFNGSTSCLLCRRSNRQQEQPLDIYGHHASVCPCAEGSTRRHNSLRDFLFNYIRHNGIGLTVRKEEPLPQDNALPWNERRRLDLFIDDPRIGDSPFAIDITVVSPHSHPFCTFPHSRRGETLRYRELTKLHKYLEACTQDGIRFAPLAMDIYGAIGPNAYQALSPITDQIAKLKGTNPDTEKYRLMLSLSSLVTQKTALAFNRRQLDRTPHHNFQIKFLSVLTSDSTQGKRNEIFSTSRALLHRELINNLSWYSPPLPPLDILSFFWAYIGSEPPPLSSLSPPTPNVSSK